MKKLNIKRKIRLIDLLDLKKRNLDNKRINLININYNQNKPLNKSLIIKCIYKKVI